MPSRILREGIIDSDRIDKLDAPAEVFYRRLMSKVDDYGLFDARPSILRTTLYPLRVDRVREADITRWIAACVKAGVIALYVHGSKPYGQMLETRWQTRSEPKHPLPPWGKCEYEHTAENTCAQVKTVETVFGVVVGVVDVTPPPPKGGARDGFDRFWSAWPKHPRKVAQKQCRKKWEAEGCEDMADRVIAALEAAKTSAAWAKNGGEFIPAPLVWLNQARWEAPTEADAQRAAEAAKPWDTNRSTIESKGVELGLDRWDEAAFNAGRGEPFPAYTARVRRLLEAQEGATA